ncbi:MAG: GNAT family N-acetyltransferase [Bacteroidales bacterium]|nr:GNAT family N-acetyltransferase [Bacteroidales bacterium]
MTLEWLTIRDAAPSDAEFLAKCIMAGMHFYDFETEIPLQEDIYKSLIESERSTDMLYSYRHTRIAEVDGSTVASLLSYPGEIYREMRDRTFKILWPEFFVEHAGDDLETGPGEYYLDSLAVLPPYRNRGIGRALMEDGIRKGIDLGYSQIALVADSDMPHLIRLYESVGFVPAGRCHAYGVDFQRLVFRTHP